MLHGRHRVHPRRTNKTTTRSREMAVASHTASWISLLMQISFRGLAHHPKVDPLPKQRRFFFFVIQVPRVELTRWRRSTHMQCAWSVRVTDKNTTSLLMSNRQVVIRH